MFWMFRIEFDQKTSEQQIVFQSQKQFNRPRHDFSVWSSADDTKGTNLVDSIGFYVLWNKYQSVLSEADNVCPKIVLTDN